MDGHMEGWDRWRTNEPGEPPGTVQINESKFIARLQENFPEFRGIYRIYCTPKLIGKNQTMSTYTRFDLEASVGIWID
jgi:hypothetical protein